MGSTLVRWTVRVGLGSVLLLALPLFPFAVTDSSVVHAAEKSDLLDINTATADQLQVLPGYWRRLLGEHHQGPTVSAER